jgi:uncharacterized protein YyaL (SSP411 family)
MITSRFLAQHRFRERMMSPATMFTVAMGRWMLIVLALAAPAAGADPAVSWRPWSPDIGAVARKQKRPIFLSISDGVSHPAYLLAENAFGDAAVVASLNSGFVPVLLNPIESPVVARAYLGFVAAAGSGADYPAGVILSEDLEPLAATTAVTAKGMQSFLADVQAKWTEDRVALFGAGGLIMRRVALQGKPDLRSPLVTIEGTRLDQLLRSESDQDRKSAAQMLHAIADGAIHDQLGGGFHRCARDAGWSVPCFEKLLSDQALLAEVYTEAWQITGERRFAGVARGTLDAMLREFREKSGEALLAGQRAETIVARRGPETLEGAYYLWEPAEIRSLLSDREARAILFHYGVGEEGNIPDRFDPAGDFDRKSTLAVQHSISETARRTGSTVAEIEQTLSDARTRLLLVRSKRPEPRLAGGVVTAWNGMAISALARAGMAFDDQAYRNAAVQIARAVLARNYDAQRKTLHRVRGDRTAVSALAQDYALLIRGLIDAYEVSFDVRFLERAIELQRQQDDRFWNATESRYELSKDVPPPVAIFVTDTDGDVPSVNAASALNLHRLAGILHSDPWRLRATAILGSFSALPPPSVAAARRTTGLPTKEVFVVGPSWTDATGAMLKALREPFLPAATFLLIASEPDRRRLAVYAPSATDLPAVENQTVVYVCRGESCTSAIADPNAVIARIQSQ